MAIEHLLQDLAVEVDPFAVCVVSTGWRLRLPGAVGATLHFVLEGTGQLRLPDLPPRDLAPCCLVVVPDQQAHALQVPPGARHDVIVEPTTPSGIAEYVAGADGDRELHVACGRVRFRYGRSIPLFTLLDRPLAVDFADTPRIRVLFEQLLVESTTPGLGRVSMLRALMTECLVAMLRRAVEEGHGDLPWLGAVDDPRLARAVAAILDDPAAPHSVASLSRVANLSRSAFASRFHEALGVTPMGYVRDVRLQRAAELLRTTDLDTATIAHRVGFASRSHFSHTFHDAFGASPADVRRGEAPATSRRSR